MKPITIKNRLTRFALIAAVAAALSFPMIPQHLRAQDEPAKSQPKPKQSGTAPRTAAKADPVTATPKVDPATVIASAGEVQLTAGEFETLMMSLPPQQQAQVLGDPDTKRQIVDRLLTMKVIAREAERRKLDQDPKVKEQIDRIQKQIEAQLQAARQQVLVQALLAGVQDDEAADKKYFEEHPEQFGQIKARHILVSTRGSDDPNDPKEVLTDEQARKKAEDIRARLVKGEDFAALAKKESDDPGSKDTGGEYTFPRGRMMPAFENVAFSLKVNEISQPVKTPFGYHIIQLLERLPGTFEQSRPNVAEQRLNEMIKQWAGGEPKLNEAFLRGGEGTAPGTPAAAQPAVKRATEKPAKPK